MRNRRDTGAAPSSPSPGLTRAAPLLALLVAGLAPPALAAAPDSLAAFNGRFEDATRRMDNQALARLWDEDGVSLLPETPPIVGRRAISAFVEKVVGQIPGATMERFTLSCADPVQSGGLASEWCFEHQVVNLGDGKIFNGRGRMLLVLRRGADGRWRLLREMWSAAEPDSAK